MEKRWLTAVAFTGLMTMSGMALAEQSDTRVMITPELYSFSVMHDGEPVEVMRNQDKSNRVHELYATTWRGVPQPMYPFAPHAVDTIGEREFVEYMMQAQSDDAVMIVDTRTVGWHVRLTIPGAQSYPYTMMDDPDDRDWALDDFGIKRNEDGVYDFGGAKTLAMFCNGYWCGQTPAMIRKLLALGYPAEKLKYYRGGMQAWTSLGFSVVGEGVETP
ncbi:rhodanese-like domain-containing protein [Marinobacterium weihaiense]|uniref:Rhodanese-like domain-containing protein n=1 Tax=Marinobacterium weihaiense TaxID=2851016 RepID=A0ABS6M867_9GAMM|nr:rhodanese-like domain-containing protein [Marinobacterium weihaiense]MBV0931982.1 rhodanese-like domain-containing protein [Marinobacterium weihaiense]